MQIVWIGSLFFAVLIALFAVQNISPVSVNLLFWRVESMPVAMVVLASAALGALTTYLFGLSRQVRGHFERRGHRSTIRNQEGLIEELRTQVRDLERENETYRRGIEARERWEGRAERPPAVVIDMRPPEQREPPKLPEGRDVP
jgi:uncharacterized integral membrane protein